MTLSPLSEDDRLLLRQLGRQYPALVVALSRLRQNELETMAKTSPEHFSTYKGRVQVLTELRQLIEP